MVTRLVRMAFLLTGLRRLRSMVNLALAHSSMAATSEQNR